MALLLDCQAGHSPGANLASVRDEHPQCCGVFVIDALDAEAIEQVFLRLRRALSRGFGGHLPAGLPDTGQVSVVGQLADPHTGEPEFAEMSARPAVDGVAVA
ncbi:Uncharacterised protein [Mycobacterium tuberculosis]|nr:Uncharacterised protein [Mycobacterium tuberculosis]